MMQLLIELHFNPYNLVRIQTPFSPQRRKERREILERKHVNTLQLRVEFISLLFCTK